LSARSTKFGLFALSAMCASAMAAATGAGAAPAGPRQIVTSAGVAKSPNGVYIVELKDQPVVSYEGGTPGLAPTAIAPGTNLDKTAASVRNYVSHLDQRRAAVLSTVNGARKIQDYNYATAGFAAAMSQQQATKLAGRSDVLFVVPDSVVKADDYQTPTFLGLTGPGGAWAQLGGTKKAGDGVIIGDIDSGITPENPVFAALPSSKTDKQIAKRWHGSCVAGDDGPPVTCNNKLIGAKWFGPGTVVPTAGEFHSPRDYDGHGSHTASTAAGDYGVPMTVDGVDFGKFSGMAPAARIAMYKALWHKSDGTASGNNSDINKAIDEAVGDGVDVINFSISGQLTTVDDPTGLAFYRAAKAGIFVSASAGNSGPTVSTVAHNYPWVTTVAAGTDDVAHHSSVTLGNGTTYQGIGLGAAVPSSPIALATTVALTGAGADGARLCYSKTWDPAHPEGYLDPAKVAGKIVVCDRGTNDRTDKSKAVREAGGVGMVLTNTSPNSLNADAHTLPTVHVSDTDGAAVKAYINGTANPTASFGATHVDRAEAPTVAAFSSRGPGQATGGDLLKPDIMAPGVDMLAAVAPQNHLGRNFDFESGTSMSAPHIAGIAALLIQAHPKWSPMAIKSVIMTSASTTDNDGNPIHTDGGAIATPFDEGAGHVNASGALAAGLVYDSTAKDWDKFLCGQGSTPPSGTCKGTIDASDVNLPSIAIGDLAGTQTITRTLTNAGEDSWVGHAVVSAPPGVSVKVEPSAFAILPGKKKTFTVTFTRTTAALNAFVFGSLTWRSWGGAGDVRSPIAIRPVQLGAVSEVHGTGASGSAAVKVQPGYSGTLATSVSGLVPALEQSAALKNATGGNFPTAAPAVNDHVAKFTVNVPAGTSYARFATFAGDLAAGTDVDMFVYAGGTSNLVASSATGSASEWVAVANPSATSYDVYIDLFAGPDQTVKQPSWVLAGNAGNLTVTPSPATVTTGTPVTLSAAWSGLDATKRYLARLSYSDGTTTSAVKTLVWVNA